MQSLSTLVISCMLTFALTARVVAFAILATSLMFRLQKEDLEAAGERSRSTGRGGGAGSRHGRSGSAAASRARGGHGHRAPRGSRPPAPRQREAGGAAAAAAAGGRDEVKMAVGKSYGLPEDTLEKLPVMSQSMVAKLMPVLVKAVLGNSFMIRQLLSATYQTLILDENSEMAKEAFKAGRAYATRAAAMREEWKLDNSKPLPEAAMGPAHVQVFLVVCGALTKAGERVGARNKALWDQQKGKLDQITSMVDMSLLVRGFRISSCFKEGNCKLVYALADVELTKVFSDCVVQLGGELKAGVAPRSNVERVLQLAIDEWEDGLHL